MTSTTTITSTKEVKNESGSDVTAEKTTGENVQVVKPIVSVEERKQSDVDATSAELKPYEEVVKDEQPNSVGRCSGVGGNGKADDDESDVDEPPTNDAKFPSIEPDHDSSDGDDDDHCTYIDYYTDRVADRGVYQAYEQRRFNIRPLPYTRWRFC